MRARLTSFMEPCCGHCAIQYDRTFLKFNATSLPSSSLTALQTSSVVIDGGGGGVGGGGYGGGGGGGGCGCTTSGTHSTLFIFSVPFLHFGC